MDDDFHSGFYFDWMEFSGPKSSGGSTDEEKKEKV